MKAVKPPKNVKEIPYPPQKKFLKRKRNSITPAKTNAPISQTFSERLKLTKNSLPFMSPDTHGVICSIIDKWQPIYLVLTKVLSTSFLMFRSTFDEISTTLYNFGKGRCTRYMWNSDMFVLWNCISATFYADKKYYLHIFPKQCALAH